jgi:hypothetical protein
MTYTVAAAIEAATREVGTRETGTNKVKYNDWFGTIPGYPHGGHGYPWCASFQSWVADRAGGEANRDYPRTAGCEVAVGWFKTRDRWSSSPHVGDWVFYGPRGSTHVELVVAVHSASIVTIGGNTSGSLEGRYYAGDGVYRKTVSRGSDRIYGYGRPNYLGALGGPTSEEEDDMLGLTKGDTGERVKLLQLMIQAAGQGKALGSSGIDGDYGPATAEALRLVRKSVGSDAGKGYGDQVDEYALSQLHIAVARNQSRYDLLKV